MINITRTHLGHRKGGHPGVAYGGPASIGEDGALVRPGGGQVRFGDDLVAAKGSDIDIVMASAKAYVNALNRHLFIEKGTRKA